MNESEFCDKFCQLTGCKPLRWQWRLFLKHFAKGELPSVIDLPTGLGKTMVIAIWLIAWSINRSLARRLIYVVDRRTVVDQATDIVKKLRDAAPNALPGLPGFSVSTLRGQLADNREWSRDPSIPAIIIGTVDLIGSALLFSGYRSSFKRRPLEAGLLGQDSLLVLDEAHLSKPFEKLLGAIECFNPAGGAGILPVKPMRVMRMSATSGNDAASKTFALQRDPEGNLAGEDAQDAIVRDRYHAKKHLTVTTLRAKDDPRRKLADTAIELAQNSDLVGKRIVVFVRKPDDAMTIAAAIRKHESSKTKQGPYAESVEVLTGTMRGLERDELVEKPVFKDRWLNGDLKSADPANQTSVFLISTSAGEVGFDLNADHLVGDEAPLDSWIQRLGRVNRRGTGDTTVILIKQPDSSDKTDFDRACTRTSALLADCPDVSPRSLRKLVNSLSKQELDDVSTPKPATVELTDILLDAWSMTSITERMPGRPDVGPWLRGISGWEPPQTGIAWRLELDLDGFAELDLEDIEEWLDTHRILPHETLRVNTSDTATWFKERWASLSAAQQDELASRPIIIDSAGMEVISLREMVDRLSRKTADSDAFLRGAELIVPASFGGIRRGVGLLDPTEPKLDTAERDKSADEQTAISKPDSIDVADLTRRDFSRVRERIERLADGELVRVRLDSEAVMPMANVRYALELVSDDDRMLRLISYVPRREKYEIGSKPQTLNVHVTAVRRMMDRIIDAFQLDVDHPIRRALELAADWHDHGKNRERWQRTVRGVATPQDENWSDQTMGKSGCEMKRDPRGYRHEFGSLREFTDAFKAGQLIDCSGKAIDQHTFDLAMHLIAAHHGRGRPHFPKGGFDPDCEARSDEIHTESIRRFARLQRKYGWWGLAWLENLLRCADALASADADSEDDPADVDGGAA